MVLDLHKLTARELLSLQAASIEELKARGLVRTANSPLGDYTEWLVATALGLTLNANSAGGCDALSADGVKYQIKGRRIKDSSGSRQLCAVRNLALKGFDYLVAVVFDSAYVILDAVVIPHEVVVEYASYRAHVNAHVLHARGKLLIDARVRSIKALLSVVHDAGSSGI